MVKSQSPDATFEAEAREIDAAVAKMEAMPSGLYFFGCPVPYRTATFNILHGPMVQYLGKLRRSPRKLIELIESEVSWHGQWAIGNSLMWRFWKLIPSAYPVPPDARLPRPQFRMPEHNSVDLCGELEAQISSILQSASGVVDRVVLTTLSLNKISGHRIWNGIDLNEKGTRVKGHRGEAVVRERLFRRARQLRLMARYRKLRDKRLHETHFHVFGMKEPNKQADLFFTTAASPANWVDRSNTTFRYTDIQAYNKQLVKFVEWWCRATVAQIGKL